MCSWIAFTQAEGIADVLVLTHSFVEILPNLDNVASQRGERVGGRFSKVIVEGLTSSKTDIRAASESLLFDCVTYNVFSLATVKKSASRLKPAVQRSIGPLVAKLSSVSGEPEASASIKESVENSVPKPAARASVSQRARTSSVTQKVVASKVADLLQSEADRSKPHGNEHTKRNSAVTNPLVLHSGHLGIQKSKAALRLMNEEIVPGWWYPKAG
jgi:hypothetical protein